MAADVELPSTIIFFVFFSPLATSVCNARPRLGTKNGRIPSLVKITTVSGS